jgi:magnesium chelatase family protein
MAMTTLLSANVSGFRAERVDVEVDLTNGLAAFRVVGLPDKAVEEARERVSAAVKNANAKPPKHHNKSVTVNLAPADTKKHGTWFDLPIALAFLLASDQLKAKNPAQPLLR